MARIRSNFPGLQVELVPGPGGKPRRCDSAKQSPPHRLPRAPQREDPKMSSDPAVSGAMGVTDAFLTTFNARDAAGHARTLAYPHVRLASGTVRTWESLEEAVPQMELAIQALQDRAGWDHSAWDHRRVIHVGPGKVHLDVQFTRYRSDDSVIGVYPAVYVIVEQSGEWLIQARSSFAP